MLYNPAGLSTSTVNSTASMNVLSWEKTQFNKVFSDGSDFVRDSFIIVPSFFAFRQKEGNWDFGVSLAVTDFSKERNSTDIFTDIPAIGDNPAQNDNQFVYIDLDNNAYKIGVSTSYRYSDSFSVGASLYFKYQKFTTVQGSGISTVVFTPLGNLEAGFNASRRLSDSQMSIQPILGLLWQKNNLSIGAKLAYQIPITRDYQATATIYLSSFTPLPPQITPVTRITVKTTEKQRLPYELSLGASYQFSQLLLTSDINYFSAVNSTNEPLEFIATPITRKLKEIVNLSLGIEYYFSKETAIRFGLFTDKSNGDIDTNIDYQRIEDIDLIGFSSSIKTTFIDNNLTFGFYYRQGRGDVRFADIRSVENAVGLPLYPDNGSFDIAKAKKNSLVLFLSLDF